MENDVFHRLRFGLVSDRRFDTWRALANPVVRQSCGDRTLVVRFHEDRRRLHAGNAGALCLDVGQLFGAGFSFVFVPFTERFNFVCLVDDGQKRLASLNVAFDDSLVKMLV